MYRFWSWRSIELPPRFDMWTFSLFFSYKNKPYVISRQKHLLYRVRIIIICITNIFATISLICISYAPYFSLFSILLLFSPNPNLPLKQKLSEYMFFGLDDFALKRNLYSIEVHKFFLWSNGIVRRACFLGSDVQLIFVGCNFIQGTAEFAAYEWGQFTIKVRVLWSILSAEFAIIVSRLVQVWKSLQFELQNEWTRTGSICGYLS